MRSGQGKRQASKIASKLYTFPPELERLADEVFAGTAVIPSRKSPVWKDLQACGIHGRLIQMIRTSPVWEDPKGRLIQLVTPRPQGVWPAPAWWKQLQRALYNLRGRGIGGEQEFTEALLLEWAGFHFDYCWQGRHWYFSNTRKRKYCQNHARAGWQAQYRRNVRERRKRGRER